MGTWGPGNFDKDSAGEFLDGLYDELIRIVRACIESNRVHQPDWFFEVYGEPRMMPTIDVIMALVNKYDIAPNVTIEEVTRWKNTYLTIYDKVIDNYAKTEHKKARREIIEKTFNDLIAFLKDWENS